jgi:hypothetical protein
MNTRQNYRQRKAVQNKYGCHANNHFCGVPYNEHYIKLVAQHVPVDDLWCFIIQSSILPHRIQCQCSSF